MKPCSEYWENRYKAGRSSGQGSVGPLRDWKWSVISKYTAVEDVVDIGCGDLSFWNGKACMKYTGIDVSPIIVEINKEKRPQWNFICNSSDEFLNLKADVVFCLDVLFHIMDEEVYINTLNNLSEYANKHIFIYTWCKNPFSKTRLKRSVQLDLLKRLRLRDFVISSFKDIYTDFKFQKYRNLEDHLYIFNRKGFNLISVETNSRNIKCIIEF